MHHINVLRAITHRFQQQPASDLSNLEFVRAYHSNHSEIFEYKRRGIPDGPSVLVKWKMGYGSAETAAGVAIREFAALENLWKRSGLALNGSIPRPISLLPELGALVTEKLPGRDLHKILQREGNLLVGPFRQKRLSQVAWLIGKFVRRFHESTRGKPQAHDSSHFMAGMSSWLEQCSAVGMEASATEEIWKLSSRLSQQMEGRPAPTAAKHGDLIPMNILVEGSHIAVLDFESFRDFDVVYEDLGMINAYLGLLKLSNLYSGRAIEGMIIRLSEGYGNLENKELLPLYTMRAALNIVAWQLPQAKGPRMSTRELRLRQRWLLAIARRLFA
jgi:hypothetical protein